MTQSLKYRSRYGIGGQVKLRRMAMTGSPLMVMPRSSTRLRAAPSGLPALLRPSLDKSITRRAAVKGASAIIRLAVSSAPLMDVQ